MSRVWIPVPDVDFDVTEVAVPWRMLTDAGHEVVFATESGSTAPAADPLLLSGVVFGQLGAEPEPRAFYGAMIESPELSAPVGWGEIAVEDGCYVSARWPGDAYLFTEKLLERLS